MAAAYLFHIAQNHPFIDGNKRAGGKRGDHVPPDERLEPTFSEDALVDLVLGVAQGVIGKDRIARFFIECTKPTK